MFHAKDGWMFERLEGGSVRVFRQGDNGNPIEGTELVLDGSSWASVVAAVSAEGESGAAYYKALALHNGEE